ncbi:unnamed protein product [Adineta steineri]|uniref:Uncharacterized protein n=1 Tax=Adineta steineri TaxID=433720 RepID=A0A819XFG0_9BILA|nr:unnamed protein product [Adineta steineri]CAF4140386.1 unnamed protein product [Adineta steineri]
MEMHYLFKKNIFSTDHVDLSGTHRNIGEIRHCLGDYNVALSHLYLTLKINKKSLPSQDDLITSTLFYIGYVYENNIDLEQSAIIYRHSLSFEYRYIIKIGEDILCAFIKTSIRVYFRKIMRLT